MQHKGKEVKVKYLPFPLEVQGQCTGFLSERTSCYLIGIDSTRSPQQQRHTLAHELAHLCLNHLDQHDQPIKEQEREANKWAWHYYREWKRQTAGEGA